MDNNEAAERAFQIDTRITLVLDSELCGELAQHIIKHGTENKALHALATHLKQIVSQ